MSDTSVAAVPAATRPAAPTKKRVELPEFVRVWELTNSIFWWPVALVPWILWGLMSLGWIGDETAAWWFLGVLAISMLATSENLSMTMSIIIILLLLLIAPSLYFLKHELDWQIGHAVSHFLSGLGIHYNAMFGNVVACLAGALVFKSISHAKIEGRWHFRQNDFEHFRALASDGSKARAGKTIRAQYPDVLKMLLGFGAGNIVILSGTVGDKVEVEIKNVFFLFSRYRIILKLISSTRVNPMDEVVAAQQAEDQ